MPLTRAGLLDVISYTNMRSGIGLAERIGRARMNSERPMRKLTPVLMVEEIESCLPFWTDRLGFTKIAEVPQGDKLGFVILSKGGVEIMYQTRESVREDLPQLADFTTPGSTGLYIEVENIEEVERVMKGLEPVVPMRQTAYGAAEIGFREPAGNLVVFAMQSGY